MLIRSQRTQAFGEMDGRISKKNFKRKRNRLNPSWHRIGRELLGDVLLFFEASEVEKCRYTCLWWKQVIDNRRKILPFKPTTRPEPPSKQPFNYWLEDELLDAYG
uniref:Uncharacterized protein n=1 Tax=Acrobeloides nanus TaxID=290746 RepID=A0A914DBM2_9BILA